MPRWLIPSEPTPKRRGVPFRVAAVAGIDASVLGNIDMRIDVTPGGPIAYSRPRPLQTLGYATRSWASRRTSTGFLHRFQKRPHLAARRPRNATPLPPSFDVKSKSRTAFRSNYGGQAVWALVPSSKTTPESASEK